MQNQTGEGVAGNAQPAHPRRKGRALRSARISTFTVAIAIVFGFLAVPSAAAESTLLADIEITEVSFTATGAVRASASYVCPSGFAPEDSPFTAFATVEQELPDGRLARKKAYPKVNFTCDGTTRRIAVKFQTSRSGDTFHPDVPLEAMMQLRMLNSEGDYVHAYDGETYGNEKLLAYIEIRDVSLTSTGAAKVTGIYQCPGGYTVASTLADMNLPDEGFEFRRFGRKVECDGTRNNLAVRFHTTGPFGDPPQPDVAYAVGLGFSATADGRTSVSGFTLQTLTIQA